MSVPIIFINNYPAGWNQIVEAIEECIKYKNKINIKGVQIMSNGNPNKLLKKASLKANLLNILKNNPPKWWENLKNDKEIVIELRSDKSKSYINCYYNGGCILGGLNCDGKGNFKGKIHYKYTPISINNDYIEYDFSNNNQNINYKTVNLRISNVNNFDKNNLSLIKKQVEKYYSNTSEKGYQYKFIQKDPYFIDSEFQYNELLGKDSRIDLVRLDHSVNKIVFVELKLFGNQELFSSKNGKNRNIEEQLELYNNFITSFKNDLREYYIDLIKLKKELGLLSKQVLKIVSNNELGQYSVAEKPLLIIAGCTQKWIDNNAKDINHRIKNYTLGCYYFGGVNENCDIKKGKNRFIFK